MTNLFINIVCGIIANVVYNIAIIIIKRKNKK